MSNKIGRLIVVYGGQWGSEGKGQICAAIAEQELLGIPLVAVRVGGPNAGHTITGIDGKVRKLQQIPVAAFVSATTEPAIGCSGLILPDVLERELGWLNETWGGSIGIRVDSQAAVILPHHLEQETDLKNRISSTGEGVGAATADKVMRSALTFGQWLEDSKWRKAYPRIAEQAVVTDTVRYLNNLDRENDLEREIVVMIEGTQGHRLSLNTSGYYPYATSRECGPDAICSQVGLSPRAFNKVDMVCVIRTYPIRVGGPSGPLPREISWEQLEEETGGYVDTPERTTVTKKIRRIARLDMGNLKQTIQETRPTSLAVSFMDYLFPEVACKPDLSPEARAWLDGLYEETGVYPRWVSTGPGQKNTFRPQELAF